MVASHNQRVPSKCILCLQDPPIENSHIVPKFVIKRLKEGSPLQTLVHSNMLNRVFQDGWKEDYLCNGCEQRFSCLEHWFCQNVYDPFLAGAQLSLKYGNELGLFICSLGFRYIRYALDKNPSQPCAPELSVMYQNLRTGLLNDSLANIPAHPYTQFLFPITSIGQFPPGINTYLFESIDGVVFSHILPSGKLWLVYLKVPSLFFILSSRSLRQTFRPSSVLDSHEVLDQGHLNSQPGSGALFSLVHDTLCDRALEIQANYSKMSAGRAEKIASKIAAVPNKEAYRAHQTYLLDMKLISELEANHAKGPTG